MSRCARRLASRCGSFFEPLETRRLYSAGALDYSFNKIGEDGVKVSLDATPTLGADAVVQSDGKTVAVGTTADGKFGIVRFNFDGTVDRTFGRNGNNKTDVSYDRGYISSAHGVAIDPEGNIIAVGETHLGSDSYAVLQRYLPNGSVDPSLGQGSGTVFDDLGTDGLFSSPNAMLSDVAIGGDDKIYVAGSAFGNTLGHGNMDMVVARFNHDGSIDESFGDGGHRYIGFGGNEFGNAMAIDHNGTPSSNPFYGTIVVAGFQQGQSSNQFTVARLTSNGNFDNRFFGNGRRLVNFSGISGQATGVTIQSGGKIVFTGEVINHAAQTENFALARLLPNGQSDGSFGAANPGGAAQPGLVLSSLHGISNDVIQSTDGGLLMCGDVTPGFAITKYSADGVLDTGFGTNGVTTHQWQTEPFAGINRLASGPGHRFVVVGGNQNLSVARFLDTGANVVGVATFNPNASESGPTPASFIVYRQERLPSPTRVYFSIGGTATAPGFRLTNPDYSLSGMTFSPFVGGTFSAGQPFVDIPANQTYAVVTLTPIDDAVMETNETAVFTIQSGKSYDLGTPSAVTMTIHDNDRPIIVVRPPIALLGTQSLVASTAVAGTDVLIADSTSKSDGVWNRLFS